MSEKTIIQAVMLVVFLILPQIPYVWGEEGELKMVGLNTLETLGKWVSGGVTIRHQVLGIPESPREAVSQQPYTITPSGPLVNIPYRSPQPSLAETSWSHTISARFPTRTNPTSHIIPRTQTM